jgi:hypothetical protein
VVLLHWAGIPGVSWQLACLAGIGVGFCWQLLLLLWLLCLEGTQVVLLAPRLLGTCHG